VGTSFSVIRVLSQPLCHCPHQKQILNASHTNSSIASTWLSPPSSPKYRHTHPQMVSCLIVPNSFSVLYQATFLQQFWVTPNWDLGIREKLGARCSLKEEVTKPSSWQVWEPSRIGLINAKHRCHLKCPCRYIKESNILKVKLFIIIFNCWVIKFCFNPM
jgi:hypothetical protein